MNSKKAIYTILILVLLTSCGSKDSKETTSEDLKAIEADCDCAQIDYRRDAFGEPIKGSLMYNINTEKVFSGTCEEKFGDGSRKEIRQYANGKLHGHLASWYENGNLGRHLKFTNGKQDGEQLAWDKKGKLTQKSIRKKGDYIGAGFNYKNGELKEAWFILPGKTVSSSNVEFNSSISVRVFNPSFMFEKNTLGEGYEIEIKDKLSDEQLVSYVKEILETHFSKVEKVQIEDHYGEPTPEIDPDYVENSQEKDNERARIAKLLAKNFPKLIISGYTHQSNTEPKEEPSSYNENSGYEPAAYNEASYEPVPYNETSNPQLYKIKDPDGYSNLRKTPGGEIIKKVYENERFEVLGEKENHKEVQLEDGTTGYIHASRVVKVN